MFLQICDAPNALYENGIIKDNEQYSSFLNQTLLLKQCSRHRSSDRVSQSDKLFTAKAKHLLELS